MYSVYLVDDGGIGGAYRSPTTEGALDRPGQVLVDAGPQSIEIVDYREVGALLAYRDRRAEEAAGPRRALPVQRSLR